MTEALQDGLFEGRGAWQQALRQALLQACVGEARDIWCIDTSFAEWPWSDAEVLDALTHWARPPRRLHLLALQYDDLRRRHPRFVQWRVRFDHCISGWDYESQAGDMRAPLAAFLSMGPDAACCSLRLLDELHWRGAASCLPADRLRLKEYFDAMTQRSTPGFGATTLGI